MTKRRDGLIAMDKIHNAADTVDPVEHGIAKFKQRSVSAKRNAQAMKRAADGWAAVSSEMDWELVVDQSLDDYTNGAFLIQQLGGEATVEPSMTATLLALRDRIIDELGVTTAHESMLVDLALLAYANALKAQRWVGDVAFVIEYQFFGLDEPAGRYRPRQKLADGLAVEEHVVRLREQLLPLVDRANRMFVRNLRAIKDLSSAPTPAVAVGVAGQVNVAVGARHIRTSSDS